MDSRTYNKIKTEVSVSLETLMNYISIIAPVNEEDKKILSIGFDMMKSMNKDVNNPSTITDALDMNAMIRDWDKIESKLDDASHMGIIKLMDNIAESYSIPEGEEDE